MQKFADIVGHEKEKDHLQNALSSGRLSHAYIFEGEEGMGKRTLARTFAALLQCEAHGSEPCGVCVSCMQAESGNHPDIIHIKPEKSRLGVDEIRTKLNSDIAVKPYSSQYKIYIIEAAGSMTEQAQNALLKTIEEPPSYGIIVLLTENQGSFLPTILSRCVSLRLKPVATGEIKAYLMQKKQTPDYLAELAAAFSGGNVGRAIRHASSDDFIKTKNETVHLLRYIDDMELSEIMDSVSAMSAQKSQIYEYLDLMMLWYRDVLIYKATQNINKVLFRDEMSSIQVQASTRSFENLDSIIRAFDKTKQRLRANVNFDLAIELLLLTIKEH